MNLRDEIERLRAFFRKKRELVGRAPEALPEERRHQFRRRQDLLLKGVEEETVAALVEMSIQLLEEKKRAESSYPGARRRQLRRRQDQVLRLVQQELGDPTFLGVIEDLIRVRQSGDLEAMERIQAMLQARTDEG